jgi:uncharacterized protein
MVPPEYKKKLVVVITNYLPNAKIYLYGSRSTGTHRPTSDIDLAIDAGEKIHKEVMANINKSVEDLHLSLEVEIVDMHSITQGHLERIEREKVLWSS